MCKTGLRIALGRDNTGMFYKDTIKADQESDPRVAFVIDVNIS